MLLTAWAMAAVIVSIAYFLADYIWIERHSLRFTIGARPARCSGAIGEIILMSVSALLVIGVDAATPANTIESVVAEWGWLWALVLTVMTIGIYFYCINTARTAKAEGQPPDFKPRLMRTYLVYGAYCIIFYTGGLVMVGILATQFIADAQSFQEQSQRVLTEIAVPLVSGDAIMRKVELSHLDVLAVLESLRDRMSPVFAFAVGIFSINMAILFTPLRSIFLNNAVFLTNLTTLLVLVLVVAVGAWTYVGAYSVFIDAYLDGLARLKIQIVEDDWRNIARYSEIVVSLMDRRSLVGFITEMSNEWGGLAAILGSVQWAVQQFRKPSAEVSPVEQEESA